MIIDDTIKDEKLQHDINREAAKISALSSGKIDKYEYLTGGEMLPSDQRRMIAQASFTYSSLGKALEKQAKTIKSQGEKQVKAIKEHGKQSVESNEVIKNDYTINRDSISFRKRKKYVTAERASQFVDIKDKINPNKLIYEFKTEEKISKDLISTAVRIIKKIKDVNPKEILKIK